MISAPRDNLCDVYRFWPDGAIDSGGKQTSAFDDITFPAGSNEVANGMAIQSDDKIVLAGLLVECCAGTPGRAYAGVMR